MLTAVLSGSLDFHQQMDILRLIFYQTGSNFQ